MGRNAAPSLAARITGNKPRAAAAVLCSAIVLMLAGWFPGDETLRRAPALPPLFRRALRHTSLCALLSPTTVPSTPNTVPPHSPRSPL